MTESGPEVSGETEEPPAHEPEPDPAKLRPLNRRDRTQAVRMKRGVRKFLQYHGDLIEEEAHAEIAGKRAAIDEALDSESTTRAELETLAESLTATCESSVPGYRYSAFRENIEVLFIAIVIALAIRAYIAQPSRIPTGSMQPTLNGILAHPTPETATPGWTPVAPQDYVRPGFLGRVFDKVWFGRSHVEIVSDREDAIILGERRFYDRNQFLLFPRAYLKTPHGQMFRIPGTTDAAENLFSRQVFPHRESIRVATVAKDDVIARGFIDTGDWVLVDKFTFHWRKPIRDDVFVFNTRKIMLGDTKHYIKRIAGEPGDALRIENPILFVNDEPATEPGLAQVVRAENGYGGYTGIIREEYSTVPPRHFFALGDNSMNSSDSRSWGPVPFENVVGRALFVYYPFGHHFGRVR